MDTPGAKYFKPEKLIYEKITSIEENSSVTILVNKIKKLSETKKSKTTSAFLPVSIIEIIKNRSVDIYPWETGRVIGMELNWINRPVFQSYITYRKWLIEQNKDFFSNFLNIPDYIIFHPTDLLSIDGRYLLNDELSTFLIIKKYYKSIHLTSDGFLLLKKKAIAEMSRDLQRNISKSYKGKIQHEIYLEDSDIKRFKSSNLCTAKIRLEQSISGKLHKILYKENPLGIVFSFTTGKKIFRILPDLLMDEGIIIYPILNTQKDLYTFFTDEQINLDFVKGLTIMSTSNQYYKKDIELNIDCF